jgi:hypothetical protein
MNPIDKEAYELAITIASRDPVERPRIEARFAKGESFREIGRDCAYSCQCDSLGLMPWQLPPSHAGNRSMLNEPPGNASGRRESAELLLRMKRLGISVWHPDPIKECERVEAARAKVVSGGF